MVTCCVPSCGSDSKHKNPPNFHEFPVNAEWRTLWLKAISRQGDTKNSLWQPKDRSVVCGVHFKPTDYREGTVRKRLIPGAVPSVFPHYPAYKQPKVQKPRRLLVKHPLQKRNSKAGRCHSSAGIGERSKEQSTSPKHQNRAPEVPDQQNCAPDVPENQNHTAKLPDHQNDAGDLPYHQNYVSEVLDHQNYILAVPDHQHYTRVVPDHQYYVCKVPDHQHYTREVPDHQNYAREFPEHQNYASEVSDSVNDGLLVKESLAPTRDISVMTRLTTQHIKTQRKSLKTLQKKCQRVRQKFQELQNKMKLLVTENKALKSKVSTYDLDALERAANNNDTKATFIMDQLKLFSKKKPKWSSTTIRHCIVWYRKSPVSYKFVRQYKLLALPSKHTLEQQCLKYQ